MGTSMVQLCARTQGPKYEIDVSGNTAQKQAAKEARSYLIECLVYNAPEWVSHQGN